MVLGYIIAGPILNLTINAKEVMRCFSCTGQLTFNLSKTKYDLMLAPFYEVIFGTYLDEYLKKHCFSDRQALIQ